MRALINSLLTFSFDLVRLITRLLNKRVTLNLKLLFKSTCYHSSLFSFLLSFFYNSLLASFFLIFIEDKRFGHACFEKELSLLSCFFSKIDHSSGWN